MLLNIITGGIGSGKSSCLRRLIEENLKNNPGTNAVLIVPEQFSYTAEKSLAEDMGGLGLNRIEVLTFSRLVHRYTDSGRNILSSGKMMLAAKAASELSEDNVFCSCAGRSGFINSCSELFSEFKRYGIMPSDLDGISCENIHTEKKITSINEIYKRYLDLFPDELTDGDDALGLFAEKISGGGLFENTFFFIDDYSDFLPGHIDVIRALLRVSRGVHIALGPDGENGGELFAPIIKTKKKLIAIALSEGVQPYTKFLSAPPEYIAAPDIRHLLENWEEKPEYNGSCENIAVFRARDLSSEVEHTAAEIIRLVRDENYRFRDIGVICGDTGKYLHIINAVFADYGIPFFTDEKLPVSLHPIAKTVLSLFGIIDENWSYRTVFDYLRAGYIYERTDSGVQPINRDDIDILENYVLKHGIKGKKAWFSEWTLRSETVFDGVIENYRKDDTDLEKLNALRAQITAPFEKFLENKGRTVTALASAVFDFLCDINLYDGILYECERFIACGRRDEAEQFKQVWNSVIQTLDQMVLTLGKGAISRKDFADYCRLGLSQCSLSIIPPGLDRVSVGTVSRNSPSRVKHLFIIGAEHGAIPAESSGGSLLSDPDRCTLNEALLSHGKEIAPENAGRSILEELKLYRVISCAEEKLSVSCPAAASDGSAIAPSRFIDELCKMFPDIKIGDNIISKPSDAELLASSKRGFYYMLNRLSEYYREKPSALWKSVFEKYAQNPDYQDKLSIIQTAAAYKRIPPRLSPRRAEALYSNGKRYSITALEKFASCPFSYYMERGLKAQPQEEKRVEKSHIGSLIHAAVRAFCTQVEDGAETVPEIHERWAALDDERSDAIIDSVINEMKADILLRAGGKDKRLEYLLSRCRRTLKKSAETIRKSLSAGGYTSVCHEKGFEVSVNWKDDSIILTGTIDRIDVIENIAKNRLGIRIIDYKSGHKKFSIAAIAGKIDMQLVLYALAAVKLARKGGIDKANTSLSPQVSAILYNRINDDMIAEEIDGSAKTAAEKERRQKLDGLVILDGDDTCDGLTPDNEVLAEMDSGLSAKGSSDYLNISFKSGKLYRYSQVTNRADFDVLEKYAAKTAVDTDRQIKSGNISIRPCQNGNSTACAYCKFREACMFDSGFDSVRKIFTNSAKAMEFIKKEVGDDEQK